MGQEETAGLVSDCLRTVQRCIVETRTLSHLLHPPLLDEAGFASAARCYVEEFDKRSEIDLRLELPDGLPRLTPALELALFRALQESLTNVHRYSGSSSVDIKVTMDAQSIVLIVRDYGRGIPEEILRNFHEHGSGVGVGFGFKTGGGGGAPSCGAMRRPGPVCGTGVGCEAGVGVAVAIPVCRGRESTGC